MLDKAKIFINYFKIFFAIIAFTFFLFHLVDNYSSIQTILLNTNYSQLGVSIVLWSSLSLLIPRQTQYILNSHSKNISYFKLVAIYVERLPTKYLPGGIWHTVTRYIKYSELGVDKNTLMRLGTIELAIPLIVALLLGGTLYVKDPLISSTALITLIVTLLLSIIINLNKNSANIAFANYFILQIFFWCIAGLSFWFFFMSLSDSTATTEIIKQTIGAYLLGWSAGNIAVFSPQGLGVAEAVIASLLENKEKFGVTITIMFGFRLVIALSDAINIVIYNLKLKRPKK